MQKYFEKIIERLKEQKEKSAYITDGIANRRIYDKGIKNAIKIVNQVAEEYGTDTNVPSNDVWIPCKNELPKEYTDVLGCDYDGNIYVVELYKDSIYGNVWRQWNGGLLRLGVILAWQPLPAPYQPKGE